MQHAVNFMYDGLRFTPSEYVHALQACTESGPIHPDAYSNNINPSLNRACAQDLAEAFRAAV